MTTATIPPSVPPERARELMQAGARIIDVRTPAEFESVHIPGSYNVPLDLLSEHRQEFTSRVPDPIILVCASGMRARQADNQLRDEGHERLGVLEGGISAWEQQGQPVIRGAQKWSLERQVRGVAGSLVATSAIGGMLVWRPLTLVSLFVGLGLTFAAITNTCGMAKLLSKLPYNRGASCDIQYVLRQLATDSDE